MSDTNRFVAKKGLLLKPYDGISQDAILKTNTEGHVVTGATFDDLSNTAHTHLWFDINSTPTTISGYSITDAYTKTEVDNNFLSANTSESFVSISGDTMIGVLTVPELNVTGNTSTPTITDVDYIKFNTGTTISATTGSLYYSGNDNALTYKPKTNNNDVSINLGFETVFNVFNNTGYQINNGKVVLVNGSYGSDGDGVSTVMLPMSSLSGDSSIISGVATHDIPNGELGICTRFGIVRDININSGFTAGEMVYLSDTVPGDFDHHENISIDSRLNKVGYILQTGTTGSILVSFDSESTLTQLSDRRTNNLSINNASSGIISFDGFSLNTGATTTYNIGAVQGWLADNITDPNDPKITYVNFPLTTGLTTSYLTVCAVTHIGIDANLNVIESDVPFTNSQTRDYIDLGVIVHSNKVNINTFNNQPIVSTNIGAQIYDLYRSIGFFNSSGNEYSANGNNLQIDKTSGDIFKYGSNYENDPKNPHLKSLNGVNNITFNYRLQNSTEYSGYTNIDSNNYDLNGVLTPVPTYKFTMQRISLFSSNLTRIQYGQYIYDSIADAQGSIPYENFITEPNIEGNGLLRGFLIVRQGATDLSDSQQAVFVEVERFGTANSTNIGDVRRTEVINTQSTGVKDGGVLSISSPTGETTFTVSEGYGVIVDNTTPINPTYTQVDWLTSSYTALYINDTGETHTYISFNTLGQLTQTRGSIGITALDKRRQINLGGILHIGGEILYAWNRYIPLINPMNQLEDLTTSIGSFSVSGNRISKIPGTLQLYKSEGTAFYLGGNYQSEIENPNILTCPFLSGSTLVYANSQTILGHSGTSVDTQRYEPNLDGVLQNISNGNFAAHRIWHQPSKNVLVFQYAQYQYAKLADAKANFDLEEYLAPNILTKEAYLVAVLIGAESDVTSLLNSAVIPQGKFAGTGGGGTTPDTLQSAYENSPTPEIFTDATRGAVDFVKGSTAVDNNLVTFQNSGETIIGYIDADGAAFFANSVSSQTFYGNLNWNYVTLTPTTISGYGITNAVNISTYNTFTGVTIPNTYATIINLNNHTGNTSNPHNVTASQISAYTMIQSNANFLSANTSFYTQQQANANFLSANTFASTINTNGINNTGNITATTYYGDGSNLTNITNIAELDQVYLTYYGTSGTTSGTKGCTLTSPGNWTITQYNTAYYFDDKDGNMTITIPDSNATNLGKTMIISKPRLVQSGNNVVVKTVSNQAVAETSTFYLRSPNDRAELISVPFVGNGAPGYKYRVNMIGRTIHEVIEVSIGGTQLFSDIKSAVDFVNAYADGPRRIKVNPGTYYIPQTIEINCPYPITLEGYGTETTQLVVSGITGTPMFDIVTKCDFKGMSFIGGNGYGLIDDECCLDCGVDGLYFEVTNVVIDGFYKGVEIEGDSEYWVFNSIIQNCATGLYCVGGNFGVSENSLFNNGIGIYYQTISTANTFSIQNTIFDVSSGQTGIHYVDDTYKPIYNFATGNAFYGVGTYISGLTFDSDNQSDIRYENNAGLEDYKPSCWVWVSGNTGITTLTTLGTYYKASVNPLYINDVQMIKYSGGTSTQLFTYLPNISRKQTFVISGDLSASNNNDVVSVALFKNGTTKLQDIDVRTTTTGQPYPFAFNAINIANKGDSFDIRLTNLTANTRTAVLRTLMFSIN